MEEKINKEFEEYQKDLEIRGQKLKAPVEFKADENIDEIIEDLKNKEVVL